MRILGAAGLHARPATVFVEIAARFAAEIRVQYAGRTANGKALASLLTLGAGGGASLCILATGPDAEAALAALRAAVESGLGDGEEIGVPADAQVWSPPPGIHAVTGIPAAPGVAIGPLFQFRAARVVAADRPYSEPAAGRHDLAQALETAREQLGDIHDAVAERVGKAEAAIFHAHQALLRDEDVAAEVGALIDAGHGAAWAWDRVVSARVADLRRCADERMAARAADLHDVGQRVLRLLAGTEHGAPTLPDAPVILVAEDLAPSDTARLDPRRMLGFCTVDGRTDGARRRSSPARSTSRRWWARDRRSSSIPTEPSPSWTAPPAACTSTPAPRRSPRRGRFRRQLSRRRDRDFETAIEPAMLTDGHRVEVAANIGRAAEAAQAVEAGAEGVGLMRTEFLFLDRDDAPSEDEQYDGVPRDGARRSDGLPLILRTLDIGGDKPVPYLALPKEENPFLGVRGIRLCLAPARPVPAAAPRHLPRLGARTGADHVPMVSSLEEVRDARAIAEERAPGAGRGAGGDRDHDRGAVGRADGAGAGARGRLLLDRHQRPDAIRAGDGPRASAARAAGRRAASRGASSGRPHGARGGSRRSRWVGVCGGIAGDPVGRAHPHRARRRRAEHEPAEHRRGEGARCDATRSGRRGSSRARRSPAPRRTTCARSRSHDRRRRQVRDQRRGSSWRRCWWPGMSVSRRQAPSP